MFMLVIINDLKGEIPSNKYDCEKGPHRKSFHQLEFIMYIESFSKNDQEDINQDSLFSNSQPPFFPPSKMIFNPIFNP